MVSENSHSRHAGEFPFEPPRWYSLLQSAQAGQHTDAESAAAPVVRLSLASLDRGEHLQRPGLLISEALPDTIARRQDSKSHGLKPIV